MRRIHNGLIYIPLLAALLLVGCGSKSQPTPTPIATLDVGPNAVVITAGAIRALGTIRPAQALQLSFGTGGPVESVLVRLGEEVSAGDVIAVLDTTQLALTIESAEQEVRSQQAALDRLVNGPNEADVERAEAAYLRQVAEAQIALQMAKQRLTQAQRRDHTHDIEVAQVGVQQAALQQVQAQAHPPTAEVAVAQVDLDRALDALAAAQDAYRKALDRPWEAQELRDALIREVQRAEWITAVAQARLDGAQRATRAHALGVEALGLRVDVAEAQLAQARDAQAAYSDTLHLLAAEVVQAELHLEGLGAWTNPLLEPPAAEDVAQARAHLRQAEIAVEQLRLQMDRAVLRAPFDGVVSTVYLRPGEWAAAGIPALEVLETHRWRVETRNVSELDIGRVRVGQEATVQVLAFDREALRGIITAISPVAVVQQGDTTYTLSIELEETDLNLRPGMNVQVEIE